MNAGGEAPTTPPWTEGDVREALRLPGGGDGRTFTTISTDTRSIPEGALFVALAGERFDAHDFLSAAAAAGAGAAVVRTGTPPVPGVAIAGGARHSARLRRAREGAPDQDHRTCHRRHGNERQDEHERDARGSVGTRYVTYATRANLNNLVGVPLTILESPAETEALVVEAGANLPGEIARYREMIRPDVVVITNAVAGHLEGFGSLEGVLDEKLSLSVDAPFAVVGADPPALAEGARRRAKRCAPRVCSMPTWSRTGSRSGPTPARS